MRIVRPTQHHFRMPLTVSSILHCRAMHFHVEQDREHVIWPSFTLPCIRACEELVVSGPHAVDFVLHTKAIEWLNGAGPKLLRFELTEEPSELQRLSASKFDDFVDGLKEDFTDATEATQYEVIALGLHGPRPSFLETNGTTKERLASTVLHTLAGTAFQVKRERTSFESS